jgi:hypothetical protein
MECSDRVDRPRHSGRRGARRRFAFLGVATLAVLVGAAVTALPSRATMAAACGSGTAGQFVGISRSIVPIGVTVIRGFEIDVPDGTTVSGVQLSAPSEYAATQIPGNHAFVLRFTAPHAGPFVVQATWTVRYADDAGNQQTCTGAGSATFNAAQGTLIAVSPPPALKFPGQHVPGTQYDSPAIWTWKCAAGTDATPLVATMRWEVDPRQLVPFAKGGNAPFRFTKRARSFTVTAGDPCDSRQGTGVKQKLVQGAKLEVLLVGDIGSGKGALLVKLLGGFHNPSHNKAPFHLGVSLAQGSANVLSVKLCAWEQTGFVVAKGRDVSCWW